jgi:hypothetical protein
MPGRPRPTPPWTGLFLGKPGWSSCLPVGLLGVGTDHHRNTRSGHVSPCSCLPLLPLRAARGRFLIPVARGRFLASVPPYGSWSAAGSYGMPPASSTERPSASTTSSIQPCRERKDDRQVSCLILGGYDHADGLRNGECRVYGTVLTLGGYCWLAMRAGNCSG